MEGKGMHIYGLIEDILLMLQGSKALWHGQALRC